VIGSQAILGSFDDAVLPGEAIGSVEVDVCFFDDADDALADQVDGAIGEASAFHSTFGYYAQGVSVNTAVLPPGWEQRLVTYASPATEPGAGLCLDPHDLVRGKARRRAAEGLRLRRRPAARRKRRCVNSQAAGRHAADRRKRKRQARRLDRCSDKVSCPPGPHLLSASFPEPVRAASGNG
jgi:hypothetical protein